MRVLTVNCGSSNVKLRLLAHDDAVQAARDFPVDTSEDELRGFLLDVPPFETIGHRVVHGGAEFQAAVQITNDVEKRISSVSNLAAIHNPLALRWIGQTRALYPTVGQVACFDTAFHAGLPARAALYALPKQWNERYGLRRYGFHGLSFAYSARRASEMLNQPVKDLRLVICHLGAGASIAAVDKGKSVDTTMGFTPLEGLVMQTRSGSVDPGLIVWLQQYGQISIEELSDGLEHHSGLAGLSGGSGDMRELVSLAQEGIEPHKTALDVYVHKLRANIAAMTAALGGLDALIFTGGVGAASSEVRELACDGLDFLGVQIRSCNGRSIKEDHDITLSDAPVRTLVIQAREDIQIATETRELLNPSPRSLR